MVLVTPIIRLDSAEDIESVKSPFTVKMLENIPSIPHPKALEERFPDAAPEALDLMRKLLHFNPNKRLTVEARFLLKIFSCCSPICLCGRLKYRLLLSFRHPSNHCGTRMLPNFTTLRMSLCARRSSRSKSTTMSSASACTRSRVYLVCLCLSPCLSSYCFVLFFPHHR
jgi:serine/threonine protein kinase